MAGLDMFLEPGVFDRWPPPPPPPDPTEGTRHVKFRFLSNARLPLSLLLAPVALLGALVGDVYAQGEIERTPWATSMVYPVGDPLDFQRPAPGEIQGFALSRGVRARGDRHEGLDLTNRASGGEVRAVAPGLVVTTRTGWGGGWGNMVVLAHRLPGGDLLFTLFAHLLPGSIAVHEGEVVALGQPLGRIGSTGHSSGPHLHLEFREMKQARKLLELPLGEAWMKASIVDPLRVLASMMPRPSSPFLQASLASTAAGTNVDPLLALVQRGAFLRRAVEQGDDPLTRAELYRIAYTAFAPGSAPPPRWASLRGRLLGYAAKLPASSRPPFAADRLPRREAEAQAPAGLAETIEVFTALERAGKAVPAGASIVAAGTDRHSLEDQFAHGLAALEGGDSLVDAPPVAARLIGPPSVTRRQASLLWAYLENGRTPEPGSAAAAGRP
jgi:murein DD-endopeptidase MepM/ murein hydrolase activator NlpD